ncbi:MULTISPECIES: hypothetical protein [Methylobacteriaceae]|uniref:hypothetical protein n=1 Tax=Methylobacteriaceae TaxID=119045 RepID=UPI002F35B451
MALIPSDAIATNPIIADTIRVTGAEYRHAAHALLPTILDIMSKIYRVEGMSKIYRVEGGSLR